MRFTCTVTTILLIAGPIASLSTLTTNTSAQPEFDLTSTMNLDPMANFARMVSGDWKLGTVQTDSWRWGPGKHSMRVTTVGTDGRGEPWSELMLYYWHPGRQQVCLLGLHPDIPGIGRGISSGTIVFGEDTVTTTHDLYQPGNPADKPRKMGGRWVFENPDAYHEELLEDSGNGFVSLAEWNYVRSVDRNDRRAPAVDSAQKISKNLKIFEPLIGHWTTPSESAIEGIIEFQSTFEWVEYLDVMTLGITGQTKDDTSTHVFDAYLYHHVGTDSLHCLALSASGGVYEGDVSTLDDGAIQLKLTGYERNQKREYMVQLDPGLDGAMRQRVWSIAGGGHTLLHDFNSQRATNEE